MKMSMILTTRVMVLTFLTAVMNTTKKMSSLLLKTACQAKKLKVKRHPQRRRRHLVRKSMTLMITIGLPRTITTTSMPSTSTLLTSNHLLQHPLPQLLLVEAVTLKIHQILSLLRVQKAPKATTHQRTMPMPILGDAEVDAVRQEAMAVEAEELVDTQRTLVVELTHADAMPELQFILVLMVVRSAMKQHLLIEHYFLTVLSHQCMVQPPWLTTGTLLLPVLVVIAELNVVEAANSNSVRPESSQAPRESSPSSPASSVKAVNLSKRSNVNKDADASQLTRSLSWITLPCLNMILT